MLVSTVTASSRGRSAPIGTPALMACTAASSMALPPSACTFTNCTPGIAAAESTAPATVFGMSWNFKSRKIPGPSAAISFTAAGPAAVKSWLPILNIPTRSATCFANFKAEDSESKSRATIRLLRGWASKGTFLLVIPIQPESVLLRQLHQLQPDLADARMNQADLPGDTIGYINFPSFLIGTPVIDTYQFKLPVPGIDHPDERTKGQVRVRGCQGLAVKPLPVRCLPAVELLAVPAGVANPCLDRLHRLIEVSHE